MKKKSVYFLLSFIMLVVNCSVCLAFQPAASIETKKNVLVEADRDRAEQLAKLIEQLQLLTQETQSFNLFSNRTYFSVLTALDLYSAAQLSDEFHEKKKAANPSETINYKPIAESYKTYLYQVVNQQKAVLDNTLDATISEHNKLYLQMKSEGGETGDGLGTPVSGNPKNIFELAGVSFNSSDDSNLNNINSRLFQIAYLKSSIAYAIGEIDAELAFDFYEHNPANSADPQTQLYISSNLAEQRASFANKLFEKDPEKAIAKLTSLSEKPTSFLTSEALNAFYKKDPKKAAQFAQKILDESFAGINSENEDIVYQKMNTYLYFLSYLKDGKLLPRTNPLITKSQVSKIVDLLVDFYASQQSEESNGNELIYIAEIISDYSPEKANFLLQNSDYQMKPKKKNPNADKSAPFTYDAPSENTIDNTEETGNSETGGGVGASSPDAPPAPTNNKPAPEVINQYYNQALQISNNNVNDQQFVDNLIKISKVFNNWEEFEKAQSVLGLAQNLISKAPTSSADYTLRFNLAQAYINSKNSPEALKITENVLGSFEYFVQGLITTGRYNRDSGDDFTDNGYELDASLNSYYAYYLQSLVSSNSNLFNELMNENPGVALNLSNKFTRKESQFVFRYYLLDGYMKYLQALIKQ